MQASRMATAKCSVSSYNQYSTLTSTIQSTSMARMRGSTAYVHRTCPQTQMPENVQGVNEAREAYVASVWAYIPQGRQ
jgi:hypothetical protein